MTRIGWDKRVKDIRQEVNLIKGHADKTSKKFKELQRQAEYYKIRFLTYELEGKRKSLTHSRGFASIVKNGNGLTAALGIAAAASILTGMMSNDRLTAANAGLSGFNGALQGLGQTDWAICLDGGLEILPRDNITAGRVWFTWDSVMAALNELEQTAQNGAHLGNLDKVIVEIRKSKKLVAIIIIQPIELTIMDINTRKRVGNR
jgi:hypothetical protein